MYRVVMLIESETRMEAKRIARSKGMKVGRVTVVPTEVWSRMKLWKVEAR